LAKQETVGCVVNPIYILVQLAPLLVDENNPFHVPAKTFDPISAREKTTVCIGKPVFTVLQFVPLSVERNNPLPNVPAKIFVPFTKREGT